MQDFLFYFISFFRFPNYQYYYFYFSYFPATETCDGNEHALQLAFAKLNLCCNVRCEDGLTELNVKNYKINITKYFEISSHFLLTFRSHIVEEEKKREKSNSIFSSINLTPILFSNMPLQMMTMMLYKIVDYCPDCFQAFQGKVEEILPYVFVHSDSMDVSIIKQKVKNSSFF